MDVVSSVWYETLSMNGEIQKRFGWARLYQETGVMRVSSAADGVFPDRLSESGLNALICSVGREAPPHFSANLSGEARSTRFSHSPLP